MPRRQAQSFDELMRRSGPVPLSRVEQTRKDIMTAVKELSEAGQIEVQLYDEATAE
jgi:flagellar motor switch protein FliG